MRSNLRWKKTLKGKMVLNQRAATCLPNLLRMLKSLQKLALIRIPVRKRPRMLGQKPEAAARLTSSKMQRRTVMTYSMRSSR
jgi:hypothetical protein